MNDAKDCIRGINTSLNLPLFFSLQVDRQLCILLKAWNYVKLCGGGGKKKLEQTPLPAKNIGTKDGHGKRNRTSSITVEGRIWLSPNSRDCAREWWWAAECTSSRRKPDIPEALSGGDSGTLATHCPLRISFPAVRFLCDAETKVHTHARASEQPAYKKRASRQGIRADSSSLLSCPLWLNFQPTPSFKPAGIERLHHRVVHA